MSVALYVTNQFWHHYQKMRADESLFIRPQTLQSVCMDYFTPIFLRISLGTTFLFTMISIVLYSTKGREK